MAGDPPFYNVGHISTNGGFSVAMLVYRIVFILVYLAFGFVQGDLFGLFSLG